MKAQIISSPKLTRYRTMRPKPKLDTGHKRENTKDLLTQSLDLILKKHIAQSLIHELSNTIFVHEILDSVTDTKSLSYEDKRDAAVKVLMKLMDREEILEEYFKIAKKRPKKWQKAIDMYWQECSKAIIEIYGSD